MSRLSVFDRKIFSAFLALIALACAVSADDSGYRQSVEQWRHDYEAKLMSDTGWLTISGLFWLHEGENRFGSDPLSDIVLPASAVPASAGYFELNSGKTTIHVNPGVPATMNGKAIQTADLQPDPKEQQRVVIGDLTLWVHASGERLAVRVRDKNSPLRRNFKGTTWFTIDEAYSIHAKFVAYDPPKKMDSQNLMGDPIKVDVVGTLVFALNGQEFRLDAKRNESGKGLFIVFRDLTSGKETYPASRFLDTDDPSDGPGSKTVEVDFNKAYNPPCAYNPYTTCPLPLPGNRMRVEIRAGEKMYKHE